jgi:hypothetical protein
MAMAKKVTWNHFRPYSIWTEEENGSKYYNGRSQYIVDTSTGDKYFNEDREIIWCKCILLTLGTPMVHAVAAIVTIVANLARLLTFYHFWGC